MIFRLGDVLYQRRQIVVDSDESSQMPSIASHCKVNSPPLALSLGLILL